MADRRWWEEPFRVFQTNLRELDAGLDVGRVVGRIAELGASAWLLNTAGIVSFYPSKLPYQHPSPWLRDRPSGDLIGDAIPEAHAHGLRVISRADFSKVHADVFETHPDWCFVDRDGEPQVYNGLYSTCPSGPYYQEKSLEIIGEVLDRYPTDGFFFNWFNFNQRDYSGRERGICQCESCRRRFRDQTGMTLPRVEDWADPAYLRWREYTRATLEDLAGRIRAFIKGRNPDVCLILRQNPDVIMHEVNNAVDRPLPLWKYWAGEVGRESRTAHPEKPVTINSVMFLDLPYRFSAEQPGLVGLHLAQTMAVGANPYAYVIGTTENQSDRKGFGIVGDLLRFHKENQATYAGLRSAAKVAIVSSLRSEERYGRAEGVAKVQKARRGAYRALVEGHVPFDILPDDALVAAAADGRLDRYDCLVLPNVACLDDAQAAALDAYVERGGGLVATYDTSAFDADGQPRGELALRSLGAARIVARRDGPRAMRSAYFRVTRGEDLPGCDDTDFVALDRAYLYVEPRLGAVPSLALIPLSRYGPPEKIYWEVETDHPGLLWQSYGKGRTAYFPWPIDALFFDLSLPEHRALLVGAVERVSAGGRQIVTSAPPQVEVFVGEYGPNPLAAFPAGEGGTTGERQTGVLPTLSEGEGTQSPARPPTVVPLPAPGRGQGLGPSLEGGQGVRAAVHLVNYSGHQDRSFHDPLEIRDIRVELRGMGSPMRARSAGLGVDLPVEPTDGGVAFTVPSLGLFDMIVLT